MRRSRDVGLYVAAALSGVAAAYALNEWVLRWWLARHPPLPTSDDSPKSSSSPSSPSTLPPAPPDDPPAPVTDTSPDPNTPPARSLPPLRTHSLPPPLPSPALLSESYLAINPDAMISSTSLHTSSSHDGEDEGASQTNSSDTDAESFEDVLSPVPTTHVISRRRSQLRNHDLFATSHISFSELGSLVAPQDEHL